MSDFQPLLIEIGTEELPPKSLAKLGLSFREQMQKALSEAGFIDAGNEKNAPLLESALVPE